jgi:DNA polymerase III epsilon subunit-like protein
MIVVDIETSGGYPSKHGIWQIGAIEFEYPENQFLEEARIDDEDAVEEEATKIHGKNEEYLRDINKQSQKQLIINFLEWMKTVKEKDLICHNPQFDECFLRYKSLKYLNKDPFWPNYHRAFDIHTIAQTKFFEITEKFLIKDDHSDMSLSKILELCGLEDKRVSVKDGEITREGTFHNALEDAKLTAECFSRLIYGKNLFPEFTKFKVPEELKK